MVTRTPSPLPDAVRTTESARAFFTSVIVLVLSAPLMLILVGFATAALGFLVIGVWVLYRVLRGWLALRDGRIVPR
jgi:uncharacterized membrane protein